jgi:hypothetical protein
MSRLKCDVRHHDADGGAGAHPLDGGQETAGPADAGAFCTPRGRGGFRHDNQCAVLVNHGENG